MVLIVLVILMVKMNGWGKTNFEAVIIVIFNNDEDDDDGVNVYCENSYKDLE